MLKPINFLGALPQAYPQGCSSILWVILKQILEPPPAPSACHLANGHPGPKPLATSSSSEPLCRYHCRKPCTSSQCNTFAVLALRTTLSGGHAMRKKLVQRLKDAGVYELWRRSLKGDKAAAEELTRLSKSNPEVRSTLSGIKKQLDKEFVDDKRATRKVHILEKSRQLVKGWVSIVRG